MLFDTDVVVWAQRGNNAIANVINHESQRFASIVSYMEFIQHAKNKAQLTLSKNFFSTFNFHTLPITEDISHRACVYVERFSLSHGMGIGDALIAATAFEHGLPLASSNYKHYQMIEGLDVVKLKVA